MVVYEHKQLPDIASIENEADAMWFAMRVTYNREMKVKQMLDCSNIINYLPMRHIVKYKYGKKVSIAQPAVRGLMFAYCSKPVMSQFKMKIPYFQYMTRKIGNKNIPIIVPDDEMNSFIKATSMNESSIEFVNMESQDLTRGTTVKIHGGELDGVVGKYMRVIGKRSKRLLVQVENIVAVAIDVSTLNSIEVLPL